MAVVVTAPYVTATGNGATTSFPFALAVRNVADVAVYVNGTLQTVGFSVTLNTDFNGGTVLFTTAPANAAAILIAVQPSLSQQIKFVNSGPYNPSTVDGANDAAAIRDIFLKGLIDRAALVPLGETMGPLPAAVSRIGKFFGFDASGNPIALSGTGNDSALRTDLAATTGPGLVGFNDALAYSAGTVGEKIKSQRVVVDLSKYVRLGGTTWPFQDLVYDQVEHGLETAGLVTNAGPANFFTPFWRASYLAAGHIGGLQAGMFIGQVRGAPDPTSTNLNYSPLQTYMSTTVNLGGTGLTTGTAKGAIFGGSNLAVAYPGATNLLNLTGTEVNIQAAAGSSVAIKTGTQIVQMPDDAVSGALVDAGLAFSNQLGAVNWNMVVCLSHPYNGQHSVKSTGTLMGTLGNPSCAKGIDLSGVTFSGNAIATPGWTVGPTGAATSVVSIGYGTGAGGTVTQATSKATGVTLNKICGAVTLNAAALAANTIVTFVLTSSSIAADDDVRVWVKSGNASAGSYRVSSEGNAAGSRTIVVENKTAGSLSEAIVLGFNVLKAAVA